MTDRISFYKVPDAFVEIEDAISNSINEVTGEITCDPLDLVKRDTLKDRADEGIEWYVKQSRNLTAQGDAIHQQIAEVQEQIEKLIEPHKREIDIMLLALRARTNRQDFNKYMVAELLQVLGADELVLSTGKKVWTKTSESVEVSDDVDLTTLDERFVATKLSVIKAEVKKAAKEGKWSIPGIEIVKKKTIQFPR